MWLNCLHFGLRQVILFSGASIIKNNREQSTIKTQQSHNDTKTIFKLEKTVKKRTNKFNYVRSSAHPAIRLVERDERTRVSD